MKVYIIVGSVMDAVWIAGVYDTRDKAVHAAEGFAAKRSGDNVHWRGCVCYGDATSEFYTVSTHNVV